MEYGYGCFFDSASLPWAMFHERDDAIAYAKAEVAKRLATGFYRYCQMHVHFKDHDKPWEKTAVWDSDDWARDTPAVVSYQPKQLEPLEEPSEFERGLADVGRVDDGKGCGE